MSPTDQAQQPKHPLVITSVHAGTLVTVFAVATALTIGCTRVYLDLTGYPSVGGKVYHLAHALWGGLFLMIACVLLLAVRGRWVDATSAVVGGVGAGLFVDEVGKFITRKNDYFFPLAAPIVYLCILALVYAAYAAGRRQRDTAAAHLSAGLDLTHDLIDGPVTESTLGAIREHAHSAHALATDPRQRAMATAMIAVADASESRADTEGSPWWARALAATRQFEDRFLPPPRDRRVIRALLFLFGAGTVTGSLITLPFAILGAVEPSDIPIAFERTTGTAGRLSFILYAVSAATAVVVGVVFLLACRALGPRRLDIPRAWRRTVTGVVLTMVVVNTTGAYLDQFATLTALLTHALLLAAMANFTTRSGHSLDGQT